MSKIAMTSLLFSVLAATTLAQPTRPLNSARFFSTATRAECWPWSMGNPGWSIPVQPGWNGHCGKPTKV